MDRDAFPQPEANSERRELGVVTDGSFSAGLTVRLADGVDESLQVGSFVVLKSDTRRYFSLINDLQLRTTDQAILADPPTESDFIRRALQGIHTYTQASVRPSLLIEQPEPGKPASPQAVRTVPPHFTRMSSATRNDFHDVFGDDQEHRFSIGNPIAMDDIPIHIDLAKLVERPSGIFGQTGTGKSVLTRLILSGIIAKQTASTLIFDMHDEYARARPDKPEIPGLVEMFDTQRVKTYTLDERNVSAGNQIVIGLNQIRPADIELLSAELALSETFAATSFLLERRYGDQWLVKLLTYEGDLKELAEELGDHSGALEATRRKLSYLRRNAYIQDHVERDKVDEILEHLRRGRHVVVQFGRQNALRDYILVANLLTRRIHDAYTEQADGDASALGTNSVRPLVVVLEEAHKFLNEAAAKQTIFGTIAREMRKFGVTLMVVDQRPSQIYDEIMSQLATRISGRLEDERDIASVLSGTSDRSTFRSMLASLEPSQQCFVMGHAIAMPMIVRTRTYNRELKHELPGSKLSAHDHGSFLVAAFGSDDES